MIANRELKLFRRHLRALDERARRPWWCDPVRLDRASL